jgi:integrase
VKLGHVRERRPGRWELRVFVRTDKFTKKKIYETTTVSATSQAEAEEQLIQFAAKVRSPKSDRRGEHTLGELLDRWYEQVAPSMVPKGRAETLWMIKTRLAPLRAEDLSRLDVEMLDAFYAHLRARGGMCRRREEKCVKLPCEHGGGAGLAGGTIQRTHVVLRAALEQGVKWNWLSANPALKATPGDVDEEEVDPPDPAAVRRLFELAAERDPELVVFLILAAVTGARRGALCALTWNEVDLDRFFVTFGHVVSLGPDGPERVKRRKTKRNKKGVGRPVPIDTAVAAVLTMHRERAERRAKAVGAVLAPDAFVFAGDVLGQRPWRPDSTTRRISHLRQLAGITEGRPIHDLRHFVVSELLAAGVDEVTVQAIVGHSPGSSTTLSVYAHAKEANQRAAASILARALSLGDEGPVAAGAEGVIVPFPG